MDQFTINLLFVGASFALYIGIAIWARAGFHIGILRRRSRRSPGHQRYGDSGGLDVCGLVHLDGGPDCLYRL